MNKDMRTFCDELKEMGPGYLLEIKKAVNTKYEPCVIQQKLAAEGKYPVLFFEKVEDSRYPLVTNLFGSYPLLGLALGVDPNEPKSVILKNYREKIENPVPVKEIPKSDSPVKEVVLNKEDVDLGLLPIVHHAENDSGKYITVGNLILRDPDTGVTNVGMYRHEVQSKNALGCMFNPAHHAAYIYRKYKELNRPMEAVLFLGHHPAAVIGCLARNPFGTSELEMMGALMDEPLEVTQAETVSLPVPAYAEVAIEGFLDPNQETGDGPFAEYTGYYGPSKKPIGLMQITAITMRKDAIYHDLDPAHREHNLAGVLTFEASVFDSVKKLVPSVTGVYMPSSGCCVYNAYVRIKKRVPGEGKSAGLAALSAEPNLKMVIVVDDDIDIYNEEQVLWAISTRFEADMDLTMIPNMTGAHLDPSAYGEVRTERGPMTTKLIIDATRPATLAFADRIVPPEEAWERIKLEDYIENK